MGFSTGVQILLSRGCTEPLGLSHGPLSKISKICPWLSLATAHGFGKATCPNQGVFIKSVGDALAGVAQLVGAPSCNLKGRRFDS